MEKALFPTKSSLNFVKQNAVFSPILMSCAIAINAALRRWSSSQQEKNGSVMKSNYDHWSVVHFGL